MKKLSIILIALFTFEVSISFSQTTTNDTITKQDSLAALADSLAFDQPVAQNQKLNIHIVGDYLLNISKMIFWPSYSDNFIIGVTDYNTQYLLNQYFSNKKIHGLSVNVVFINHLNSPFVNLIYIPPKKNANLSLILQNYTDRDVIFVSANRLDWAKVDFVIKPVKDDIVIRANKDNIAQKKVIIDPLLAGLSMVY